MNSIIEAQIELKEQQKHLPENVMKVHIIDMFVRRNKSLGEIQTLTGVDFIDVINILKKEKVL